MLKDLEKRKHGNVWHPKPPLTHSTHTLTRSSLALLTPFLPFRTNTGTTGPSHASELACCSYSQQHNRQAAKVACRCGCQDYSLGKRNKFLSSVHAMSC